jgi:drug/metabolite transporter (DMT)-like permease
MPATKNAAPAGTPDAPAGTGVGTASGLAAVTMWGLAPVATRALVAQLAPLPLLVVRIGVAGLILLPWCWRVPRRLSRASLTRLVLAGLLCMVGYNLPVTIGVQWIPAATAALILATEPVAILLLSRVFLKERVPRLAWTGAAVAMGGIVLLAGRGALSVGGGGRALAGIGLVVLATVLFAAYTIVLRPLSKELGAGTAAAASTAAGAVPYVLLAWMVSPHQLGRLPASGWGELAFLSLGCTVVGMGAWSLAVARAGSTRAGLLLYAEPVVGVAGAVIFLGERLSAGMLAGGTLILAGVAIAWTAQRPRPSAALNSTEAHGSTEEPAGGSAPVATAGAQPPGGPGLRRSGSSGQPGPGPAGPS